MEDFPRLSTERLILRKISAPDIPKIVEYAGNIGVAETTLNIPHPYSEKDAKFWINIATKGFKEKSQYTFGIELIASKEFIGGIGLIINQHSNRAELGYWIAKPFWNQGFATEATKAILTFGFNLLNLNKIYATHLANNPSSGKVMIKNNMIKEGVLKDHILKGNRYQSMVQYGLTHSEFDVSICG